MDERKEATGHVGEPAQIDGHIYVRPEQIKNPHAAQLQEIENPEALGSILLMFAFLDNSGKRHIIEGSAVMVALGIALTATHVFRDRETQVMTEGYSPHCISLDDAGLKFWDIKKITYVGDTDLMLLSLVPCFEMPKGYVLRSAQMTTRLPGKGEMVEIYGFRAGAAEFPVANGGSIANVQAYHASGVVTEQYPTGRDSALLPWPCVEVDCPSVGGMSGGPAFDANGRCFGVLSTSFGEGPSYVTMLWAALMSKIEIVWPTGAFPDPIRLVDMADGLRFIERADAIIEIGDEAGRRIGVRKWWEGP
jgi:hypothetical protein